MKYTNNESEPTLIYITKSALHNFEFKNEKFYTEINGNEEGNIHIHFDRGFGSMNVIILEKERISYFNVKIL